MEDRKRALVSRLLQRTAEGKPYLLYLERSQECDKLNLELPNFNFSASHHGDFVAIASEPICLVGLDVASQTIPEKESVKEFIQSFSSFFSRLEWFNIINAGSSRQILNNKGKFDELIEDKGVKILIDPKALMHVIGTEMDFVDDKLRSEFIFVNPNATGQCGCGESFMTTTSSEAAKLRGKSS
ncbi:hypothetical protein KY284_007274 [Solanum tuberosum]|nr:hypothetical protein KY284_007274 [Solanum tuberosum]